MTAADRLIRWSTAGALVGVAAVVSYEHASNLVAAHGETGFTARLIAATLAANVAHGLGHGLIGAAVARGPPLRWSDLTCSWSSSEALRRFWA